MRRKITGADAPGNGAPYLHSKLVLERRVERLEREAANADSIWGVSLREAMRRIIDLETVNSEALDALHAKRTGEEAA